MLIHQISRGMEMRNDRQRSRVMDLCARVWLWVGHKFQVRPVTLVGVVVGAILFASALTFVLVEQHQTTQSVEEIRSAFCSGQNPDPDKCQQLFDALLKNPTPEQAQRLKELVK